MARTISSAHTIPRIAGKVILWSLIFVLELAAAMTAFVFARIAVERVRGPGIHGNVTIAGSGTRPALFFACCESNLAPTEAALSNPEDVSDMKDLGAGVGVAITDMAPARAEIVRRLNAEGIPAIAWLLLPPDEGYYANADNAAQMGARFDKFQAWTHDNGLRWSAVGLDIEPDVRDFDDWKQGHKARMIAKLAERSFDEARARRAREDYAALIARMQSQGYAVQTYQMPFVVNARNEHSTLFERVSGIVDVPSDLEVLMLYTNSAPSIGPAMLWKFGPDAQAISVGTTVGDAANPALTWSEFSRDLVIASHFTKVVAIYDLEGTVQQGFLAPMKTIDWSRTVTIPQRQIRAVTQLSQAVQAGSWTISLLPFFALFFLVADVWFIFGRAYLRPTSLS